MRGVAAAAMALAACGSSDAPAPTGWAAIHDPVLGYDDAAIKDMFVVDDAAGAYHFGFSYIRDDPFRVRLGFATSSDLVAFGPLATIDQPEVGGLASPDVVRAPDGRYVMTYNSHTHDVGAAAEKLYYRTSSDLVTWSEPVRIHVDGVDADDERLIDAALAFAEPGALLFFKRGQKANVAVSPSGSIDGPWTLAGQVDPADLENYQLLAIDGVWHMLGTSIPLLHRPVLHRLDGDPSKVESWTHWKKLRELEIPEQSWNTGAPLGYERDNAAYLLDGRARDGFFLLFYAGSTELQTYGNRGHSSIGVARSRDLVVWEPATSR